MTIIIGQGPLGRPFPILVGLKYYTLFVTKWIPNQCIIHACTEPHPYLIKTVNLYETTALQLIALLFHFPNLRSATYTVSLGGGMALARGVSCITNQITDHSAPYWYEPCTAAINNIRVLDECWRMIGEHNTLSLRHVPFKTNSFEGYRLLITLSF